MPRLLTVRKKIEQIKTEIAVMLIQGIKGKIWDEKVQELKETNEELEYEKKRVFEQGQKNAKEKKEFIKQGGIPAKYPEGMEDINPICIREVNENLTRIDLGMELTRPLRQLTRNCDFQRKYREHCNIKFGPTEEAKERMRKNNERTKRYRERERKNTSQGDRK